MHAFVDPIYNVYLSVGSFAIILLSFFPLWNLFNHHKVSTILQLFAQSSFQSVKTLIH